MRVRLLDRYLAVRFLKPFLFGMGVFGVLIFLVDVFDKMPRLLRSPAPLWMIMEYLWLEVPYWSVRMIPMATMLATLFAVNGFIRSGEWLAVQSAGFEPRRVFRPLLAMAAAVTLVSFAAQETVLPACYTRAQRLWRERIHPEWEWDIYQHKMLTARPGVFLTTSIFTVKDGKLERPVADYYAGGRIVRQLDARVARWDAGAARWVFFDGVERVFGDEGRIIEKPFKALKSDIETPPPDLRPRQQNPDEMSILETRRYLGEIGRLGGSSREAWAALHAKIAYPFSNLVLCALGIPIALRLRAGGQALSFAGVLAVCFLFLWVMEMGRALGSSGRMHPLPAAWLANAAFGAAAWWLDRRTTV